MANTRKVQIVGIDPHQGVGKNGKAYSFVIIHGLDHSEAIASGVPTVTYRLTPEQAKGLAVDNQICVISHWYKNKNDKWLDWIDDIIVIG